MFTKTIEAIILSRKNIGEADRLLIGFSKEEGKIKIIARGARKIKSKMASHIEPFCRAKYFIAEGKKNILAGAECTYSAHKIGKNLEIYKLISYAAEITDFIMPEGVSHPKVYMSLANLIKESETRTVDKLNILVDQYLYLLLLESGLIANLKVCKRCHLELEKQKSYSGGLDGILCEKCSKGKNIDLNTYKILSIFAENNPDKLMQINNIGDYHLKIKKLLNKIFYDILPKMPKSETI